MSREPLPLVTIKYYLNQRTVSVRLNATAAELFNSKEAVFNGNDMTLRKPTIDTVKRYTLNENNIIGIPVSKFDDIETAVGRYLFEEIEDTEEFQLIKIR